MVAFFKAGASTSCVLLLLLFSGCSTMASWWADDESPAIRPASASIPLATPEHANGIEVQWQVDLDQRKPASPSGFSEPFVARTASGERIVAGAQDRRVRIYDVQGHEINRIALDQACESGGLQLTNGLVIMGDVGGHLYGVDVDHGVIVWRQDLPSVLMSEPVALDDGFVIQTADNRIYRFAADGKKLWSYSGTAGGLSMRLTPAPLVRDGQIFAAFSNGDVVSLKPDSGSLLWKRQLILNNNAVVLSELRVPVATPVLIPAVESNAKEDMLLVPIFQGDLVFLSKLDGSRLIERALSLKSSPLLMDSQLFTADASGALSALDAATGETLWKQQLSRGELTGPVLWHGELWVADDQGKVYRLNRDGKILSDIQLSGRIDRSPVATEGGVLVRNSLGTLYKLN